MADADLDTLTCIALGQALYRTLARQNEESEFDEFQWEDAGVLLNGAMVELDTDISDRVLDLVQRGFRL